MGRHFDGSVIDEPRAGAFVARGREALVTTPGAAAARGSLIARARRGDEPAFELLVTPCIEPAFRRVFAILGNESDARDAVQDALLNAWRGLHGLHDPDRFEAWFGRVVQNACRAVGRRRGRSRVREIRMDVVDERYPDHGAGARPEDRGGAIDELERAFERLPVPQREILVLHHLEHRPVTEIAADLGVPSGTVMWRLHRARAALSAALEEERR